MSPELTVVLCIAGFCFFLFILTFLPDSAHGEATIRVSSAAPVLVRTNFQVVVLGDIGRSPRMQYHALSIAKHGAHVDIIGYQDSDIHPGIVNNKLIDVHVIPKGPAFLRSSSKALFPLLGPLKALFQAYYLYNLMGFETKPPKWIIVQNPPSIPTLIIASAIAFLRKSQLVIDWHNFGYSILALRLGKQHTLVRICERVEKFYARRAALNVTVSAAMAHYIKKEFRIPDSAPILTVHDRPFADFEPFTAQERTSFFKYVPLTEPFSKDIEAGKLKVIVSSTSWTPDEDFGLFLDALVGYSKMATSSHPQLPELLVIITGKGPLQSMYSKQILDLKKKADDQLEMVSIRTAWLKTETYAGLLASADLGVSLHKSTSGLDLPMKVVDMFGAGLPVVGWSGFESWSELVQEGVNGRGFRSADQLRDILVELFGGKSEELKVLREGAVVESKRGWDQVWEDRLGKALEVDQIISM